jgi:hypothetical protein
MGYIGYTFLENKKVQLLLKRKETHNDKWLEAVRWFDTVDRG